MWTTLLLLFTGASALTTGAVISACILAGRIDSDQVEIASDGRRSYPRVGMYDVDLAYSDGASLTQQSEAPALVA